MADITDHRHWYLVFKDQDTVVGLLGPFRGGRARAQSMMDGIQRFSQMVVDQIDWDTLSDALCVPHLYETVGLLELSAEEIQRIQARPLATDAPATQMGYSRGGRGGEGPSTAAPHLVEADEICSCSDPAQTHPRSYHRANPKRGGVHD